MRILGNCPAFVSNQKESVLCTRLCLYLDILRTRTVTTLIATAVCMASVHEALRALKSFANLGAILLLFFLKPPYA